MPIISTTGLPTLHCGFFDIAFGPAPTNHDGTLRTPAQAAADIRAGLSWAMPTTREEYYAFLQEDKFRTSAYFASCAIEARCGCSYEEAVAACEYVMPELFGDYWTTVFNRGKDGTH